MRSIATERIARLAAMLAMTALVAACSGGSQGAAPVQLAGDGAPAAVVLSTSATPGPMPTDASFAPDSPAATQAPEPISEAPEPASAAPSGDGMPRVVALGDSYTAAYGFFSDGSAMSATQFFTCGLFSSPPAANNPCSSNSTRRNSKGDIEFAPDYGFSNQVSWAAQVAFAMGITDDTSSGSYANLAISGSTAVQWAQDKISFAQFDGLSALDAAISLKPTQVLMTLGGNPTLAKIVGDRGKYCYAYDKAGDMDGLRTCLAGVIADDGTYPALVTVYTRLLDGTDANILVVTYPEVVPSSAAYSPQGLLVARQVLDDTVMRAIDDVKAGRADGDRLRAADPQFGVGLPPGDFTSATDCIGPAMTDVGTDGPSNQSIITQDKFAVTYSTSGWCGGPAWIISNDTGIHPNPKGYAQIARVAMEKIG